MTKVIWIAQEHVKPKRGKGSNYVIGAFYTEQEAVGTLYEKFGVLLERDKDGILCTITDEGEEFFIIPFEIGVAY